MTNPFRNLFNEIIDMIFNHLSPSDVWMVQNSIKSTEHMLDSHLLARRHAVDDLMEWACRQGSIQAVNKAVLLGADPSLVQVPETSVLRYPISTIALASNHLDLVKHLFHLGATLPPHVHEDIHAEVFFGQKPQLLKICLEHCPKYQFTNLQVNLDLALERQVRCTIVTTSDKRAAAMDKVKYWLELGANPTALCRGGTTSLDIAILSFTNLRHTYYPSSIVDPLVNLLLSAKPDLNANALYETQNFMAEGGRIQSQYCPIRSAIFHMFCTKSTKILELLLQAGAKLDLPVYAELNPLVYYASICRVYDADLFDFLFSHGASVRPKWLHDERGVYHDVTPIHKLWEHWGGRRCLLDDYKFAVIKLFIGRHAVQDIAAQFVRHLFRPRAIIDDETEFKPLMMKRSRVILKLILRNCNFKTSMVEEMEDLFHEIIQLERTNSPWESIVDPILKDMLIPYIKLPMDDDVPIV
ncbi:hypothetical protein FPSE_06314 [Fusarium pseudograminearum CS3096]|uniref:Uncharacterized protein n=1 Tax=Fusarium pseudograminearum (strain CS3096) TaxID=1028729 RepID=K3UNB0_FUSPC|nr:hypothetical protein FPSE_06314 [Fusarium pseudograminearum CS3096]EKJ73696.1 hypothetical protein FPSE_06314 [Fusarium pseudograminearum CS3096]